MFHSPKAQLIIDSVSFTVQTGAVVTVTGDISSAKGLPGFGKFLLQGTDSQSVNMNGNTIPNLEIDNSNGVWLTGDMRVSNSLLFTSGKFISGDHNFSLADLTSLSGMGGGKFIETNGAGRVIKEVTANLTSNEIPVGAGSIYRPAFLTTTGSNSGAKIGVQVLDSASANKPPFTRDYLNTNWTITQTGIAGTLNVSAKYDDPTDIIGTESNLSGYVFDGTDWASSPGAINTTANTISFPISLASENITAINPFIVAKAKVYLQGAYDTTSHLMTDKLRLAGVIPLSDPYRQSPYSSYFTQVNDPQTETISSSVLNDQVSAANNIVDWVFLELRNNGGTSVLETRSALLQRDGDIVDIDGKSAVTFNNVTPDSYTVAIRHRNHLGLSTDPSSITPLLSEKQSTAPLIDFTTSNTLYGGSTAHGIASDGKFVLWAGNANGDGKVSYTGIGNDKDYIYANILNYSSTSNQSKVYSPGDLNMDNKVSFNGISNDKDFLYNNILGSSSNTKRTAALP